MAGSSRRAWLLVACGLSLVVGCGDAGPPGEDVLGRIQREKVVRVGFANEAPYAYVDGQTGRLTGEAPEIARHVLRSLGAEQIEGVLTEFGALIPALQAGRFDVIAAGMYVTPERCRQVAFSEPTYSIGGAFLVQAGNPLDVHSYADVKANPEARLGVMAGAVELRYARSVGIPEEQRVMFPDPPSGVAGLLAGRIDAVALTALTARDLLAKSDGDGLALAARFEDPVIDGTPARGYGAFVFRKEDGLLREAFDRELATFIGSEAHLELVRPFGFTAGELPGGMRTQELCSPVAAP